MSGNKSANVTLIQKKKEQKKEKNKSPDVTVMD